MGSKAEQELAACLIIKEEYKKAISRINRKINAGRFQTNDRIENNSPEELQEMYGCDMITMAQYDKRLEEYEAHQKTKQDFEQGSPAQRAALEWLKNDLWNTEQTIADLKKEIERMK